MWAVGAGSAFERDSGFDGRYVESSPILGFGYFPFWTPERVAAISDEQGWSIPHAHEMYLDSALDLGIPGATAFVSIIFGALLYWYRAHQRSKAWEHLIRPAPIESTTRSISGSMVSISFQSGCSVNNGSICSKWQ